MTFIKYQKQQKISGKCQKINNKPRLDSELWQCVLELPPTLQYFIFSNVIR